MIKSLAQCEWFDANDTKNISNEYWKDWLKNVCTNLVLHEKMNLKVKKQKRQHEVDVCSLQSIFPLFFHEYFPPLHSSNCTRVQRPACQRPPSDAPTTTINSFSVTHTSVVTHLHPSLHRLHPLIIESFLCQSEAPPRKGRTPPNTFIETICVRPKTNPRNLLVTRLGARPGLP